MGEILGGLRGSEHSFPNSHDELTESVQSAFSLQPAGVDGFRDSVYHYVDVARSQGDPVERVIIDLKALLNLGGQSPHYAPRKERALAEGVIQWCTERYYYLEDPQ